MRKLLNKIIIFSLTCCLVGCSTQVSSQSTSTSETSSSSMTTTSTSSSSKASSSSRVILPSSSSALPPNEIGITLLSEPYRTKYYSSDKLSLDGGQIRVCSTIETCKTLDMEGNVSVVKSLDSSKNGTQEITLKYNDNKFTKTFSYDITMEVINQNEKGPTSLVTGEPVELNQQVYMDNYNYSSYDFRDANEWLKHLNFNSYDTFPSSQYLPEGYDPEKIMEWGQTPVLGISSLHERGITGYGVNIAYIDQRLRTSHEIIKDANITYYDLQKELQQYVPSNPNKVMSGYLMHGISVASLIVGKGVGAAPEVNLHFFGTPEMMLDQRGHATAIYKVLEVNKTLPQAEKIRVIGFSDNPSNDELNIEAFQEAVRVANSEGILVLFADNMRYDIRAMDDRDNPGSYRILGKTYDKVGFPTSYTLGGRVSDDYYTFWSSDGTSWTTPVEISLVAMALQVYPQIDVFKIEDLMRETAYHVDGSLLINPVGFINRVEKLAQEVEKPYYYAVVYNSEKTDDNDVKAIQTMGELMENEDTDVRYYDAKKTGSAADILQTLIDDYDSKYQQLIGVQIIGTYAEVPSFIIKDKVDMGGTYGIHDAGLIYTDHFYANFKNSPKMINTSLSMYSTFSSPTANNYSVDTEGLGLNLYPEWPVARLLLKEGQIDDYLFKYLDYLSLVKNEKNTLVNFSNPIFANSVHKDDFGYFISKTLSKKQIVNDYRLYGNEKGMYPVTTSVLGDFTKENLALENEKGIMNFVINTHGQEGNIDRAYYTTSNSDSEQRESFANNSNINSALATNYYNLYQWTCWGAANLNDKSIIYTMLSEGKAINIIGSSYLFSNNGMDVYESYPSLLGSNPISLFYTSMEGIYQNNVS
ncbi:MAG: S8/S53 family peptidase, partial [Bacilli bacterium]|nr:S8/S53 family peptidase [Bacilli bacterium]